MLFSVLLLCLLSAVHAMIHHGVGNHAASPRSTPLSQRRRDNHAVADTAGSNDSSNYAKDSDAVSLDRGLEFVAGAKSCRCNPDRNPNRRVACQIAMSDNLNNIESVLTLRGETANATCASNKYRISVRDNQSFRQTRKMRVKPSTQLEFRRAGVPQVDCALLVDFYALRDDEQLTFREMKSCTDFEKAAIYFLINEWFYFG